MDLMNLFKKAKPADEQPTAVEYVEWLLLHMLRTSRTELMIDTRRALPGSKPDESAAPPLPIPDARIVINRLKILSGVNPIGQAGGAGGTFERPRANHTVFVTTHFQDDAAKSVCSIQLSIRGKNP